MESPGVWARRARLWRYDGGVIQRIRRVLRLGLTSSSIGHHLAFAVVGAVLGAIFSFPVGLGIGWFWGTLMAATLGIEPDAKAAKSENVTTI